MKKSKELKDGTKPNVQPNIFSATNLWGSQIYGIFIIKKGTFA